MEELAARVRRLSPARRALFDRLLREAGIEVPGLEATAPLGGLLEMSTRREALLRLAAGGPGRPFFCVHGVGGSAYPFLPLARLLGASRPFHALQSPGLDGRRPPLETVETMAATYLAELRAVQPVGPYLLGGWCFGALVAFEMARQLEAAGERIDLLAILDMPAPADVPASAFARRQTRLAATPDDDDAWFADAMRVFARFLGREVPAGGPLAAADLLPAGVPAEVGVALLRGYVAVYRANALAGHRYCAAASALTPVRAPTALFYATGKGPDGAYDPDAWTALAPARRVDVPGDHFTFLVPPHVAALARALEATLAAAG